VLRAAGNKIWEAVNKAGQDSDYEDVVENKKTYAIAR